MQPLPDGTFRFSPHDLVAYLEGDFAAWCERTQAERDARRRGRTGGAGAGPPRTSRTRRPSLAARYGRDHELHYLAGLREPRRRPGRDPQGRPHRRGAHPGGHGRRRPGHLPGPHRRRRLARLPRLPLPLPRKRLRLRRRPLHALGHQARPLSEAAVPGPALRLRRHARGRPRLSPGRDRLRPRPGRAADLPDPGLLLLLPPAPPVVLPVPVALERGVRARSRARPRLGPLGVGRRAAARGVRPPEPGRLHHPRAGAPAGGGRDPHAERPRPLRAVAEGVARVGRRVRAAPRPGSAPARVRRLPRAALAAAAAGARGAAPRAGADAAAVARATSSSTSRASPTPSAGSSTCGAR